MKPYQWTYALALTGAIAWTGLLQADEQPSTASPTPGIATLSTGDQLQDILDAARHFKAAGQFEEFRAKYAEASALFQAESANLSKRQAELQNMMNEVEPPQVKMTVVIAEATNLDPAVLSRLAQPMGGPTASGGSSSQIEIYRPTNGADLLQSLEEKHDAQVISRPTVLAVDNQVAEIQVGSVISRPTSVNAGNGVPKPKVKEEFVGTRLSMVPKITSRRSLVLDLTALRSDVSGREVPVFATADGKETILTPILDVSQVQTTLKSENGQTTLVAFRSAEKSGFLKKKSKTTLILLTPVIDAATAAAE